MALRRRQGAALVALSATVALASLWSPTAWLLGPAGQAAPVAAERRGAAQEGFSFAPAAQSLSVGLVCALAFGLSRLSALRPSRSSRPRVVRLAEADAEGKGDAEAQEDAALASADTASIASSEDDDLLTGEEAVYGDLYGEDDADLVYDDTGDRQEVKCIAKGIKGSAWKYRRLLWHIANRPYREALMILEFLPWKICRPTLKCLQTAAANAQNQFNMDKSRLYISKCFAMDGPSQKKARPAPRGQVHFYMKKTTHLWMYVSEMADDELEDELVRVKRRRFDNWTHTSFSRVHRLARSWKVHAPDSKFEPPARPSLRRPGQNRRMTGA